MLFVLGEETKTPSGINQRLAVCTLTVRHPLIWQCLDYPQSKQMIRNKQHQWHIWPDFVEMLPHHFFFYSWPTLAPSCLNTLFFPEYHENMWEPLRKYLSQADTALHFSSISSLWISADLMARRKKNQWQSTESWGFLKELFTTFKTAICLLLKRELTRRLWRCGQIFLAEEHEWNQTCHCLQCMLNEFKCFRKHLSSIQGKACCSVRSI